MRVFIYIFAILNVLVAGWSFYRFNVSMNTGQYETSVVFLGVTILNLIVSLKLGRLAGSDGCNEHS